MCASFRRTPRSSPRIAEGTGDTGSSRLAESSSVLKYGDHREPHALVASATVPARSGVPATTPVVGASSWLMKKLSLKFGGFALWTVECRCHVSFTARYPMLFSLIFSARFDSAAVA